jgi:flagellar hook-basal body complex protein FliE
MNIDAITSGGVEGLLPAAQEMRGGLAAAGADFQDLLHGLVEEVDSLQKNADASIEGLVTGETTDIHDVTIKMEEASIAFDLMMEIRNKLLEAYQQIIKIQA